MPTHATAPSAKVCRFQIGTRAFISSMSSLRRRESLGAVPARDRDDDRQVADGKQADAVDGGHRDASCSGRDLGRDRIHHLLGVGVRLVLERVTIAPRRLVAHGPDE